METSRQQPIDLEPFAWAHFSSRQLLFILRTADGVINNYGTGILRQAARLIETDLARSLESTCSGRQAKLNKYLCNFGSRQSDHSVISRCLCSVWHLSDLEVREVAIGAGGNADCCYYCFYVADADLACLNDTWIRRLFLHVAPAWATAMVLWSEAFFSLSVVFGGGKLGKVVAFFALCFDSVLVMALVITLTIKCTSPTSLRYKSRAFFTWSVFFF